MKIEDYYKEYVEIKNCISKEQTVPAIYTTKYRMLLFHRAYKNRGNLFSAVRNQIISYILKDYLDPVVIDRIKKMIYSDDLEIVNMGVILLQDQIKNIRGYNPIFTTLKHNFLSTKKGIKYRWVRVNRRNRTTINPMIDESKNILKLYYNR